MEKDYLNSYIPNMQAVCVLLYFQQWDSQTVTLVTYFKTRNYK